MSAGGGGAGGGRGAHLPTTMGLVQPGTMRGTLLMTMGSRNTVPLRMLRMVPLGDFHICVCAQWAWRGVA